MNFNHKPTITLLDIKEKVKKDLKKSEHYMNLKTRKEQIFNYIKILDMTKDENKLIENYDKINEQMKEMELQKAYEIVINNKKKKNVLNKYKIQKEEDNYDNQFNKIIEDTNYKNKMRKREVIFKKLSKKSNKFQALLYELESIQTEMATLETEKVKQYTMEIVD